MWSRCLVAALLLGASATAATAQVTHPAVSVGAGAGVAWPLHGDLDFTPWTWETDVRVALSSRVVLEVAGGEWRHSRTTITTDIPGSVDIDRIDHESHHVRRTGYVSLLAAASSGRARVSGGGGVGLQQDRQRSITRLTGCTVTTACGTFQSSSSRAAAVVQGVGDVSVAMSAHASLFARVRLIVPAIDPGNSDVRVLGGVRLGW